jgi:putative ABC transport system permease protein
VSFSLIAILFAIIAIGIANTMIISVRERTREIGTLRAVGMHKRQVLLMFMLEALILGFVATVVGALSGALISVLLTAAEIEVPIEAVRAILLSDVLHLKVEPVQTAISILVLTLFTGISALWPALRGARMQPVDALQAIE